jgi:hypothetical protein
MIYGGNPARLLRQRWPDEDPAVGVGDDLEGGSGEFAPEHARARGSDVAS